MLRSFHSKYFVQVSIAVDQAQFCSLATTWVGLSSSFTAPNTAPLVHKLGASVSCYLALEERVLHSNQHSWILDVWQVLGPGYKPGGWCHPFVELISKQNEASWINIKYLHVKGVMGKVKQKSKMGTLGTWYANLHTMVNEHLFNGVVFEKRPECAVEKYKQKRGNSQQTQSAPVTGVMGHMEHRRH